jgi:hypothetical protein
MTGNLTGAGEASAQRARLVAGTDRLTIPIGAWEQLDLETRSGLMARDVFPVIAGGAAVRPRNVIRVPGMGGRFYDWRGTGLLPPSGGRIRVLIAVEHIPVIPQMAGVDDFMVLARVLRQQGLSLQCATDAHGNAGQYNRLDSLCYQARGANPISYGVEHMHLTISEPWTERQFRAAAYIAWRASEYQGVPLQGARLLPGDGYVRVQRKGHAGHKAVSDNAGYHDRTDPGPGFRWGHVYELARHFDRRRRF